MLFFTDVFFFTELFFFTENWGGGGLEASLVTFEDQKQGAIVPHARQHMVTFANRNYTMCASSFGSTMVAPPP